MSDEKGAGADVAERDSDDEITEADRQVLREIIRDELRSVLPKLGDGAPPSPGGAAGPEPAGGDLEHADPANLSLRQITDRMMILTGKALDKIPGGAKTPAEPKRPAPEKRPVPRGLKVLGFHDLD